MSDVQLLETLLFFAIPQRDVNPLARELIYEFKNISGVLDAEPSELKRVSGVGSSASVLIKLVTELIKRYRISKESDFTVIGTRQAAMRYLKPYFATEKREQLHLLCLDGGFRLLKHEKLEEGTENEVGVYVKKVCSRAVATGAVNVLIAHNHPSGVVNPSDSDDGVTESLLNALAAIGVRFADHIIVAGDVAYSYSGSGRMETLAARGGEAMRRYVADCMCEFTDE